MEWDVLESSNELWLLRYAGKEVEELWHEYESASSPEAQLVKDFDKVRSCQVLLGHQKFTKHMHCEASTNA